MMYRDSLLLTGEKWSELDDNQKVEVLQTIENHVAFESHRIPCPVFAKGLYTGTDGIVLGSYDPSNRVIYVNSTQFDSEAMYGKTSKDIITACLHEGRHAYQHQVADGMVIHDNPEEAEIWRNNLSEGNYISFKENPRAYYNQPVEVDARTFAEQRYIQLNTEREALAESDTERESSKDIFERQMSCSDESDKMAASFLGNNIETNKYSVS